MLVTQQVNPCLLIYIHVQILALFLQQNIFFSDLMLPGVIVRGEVTPNTFKGVEKGQICSVSLLGNR